MAYEIDFSEPLDVELRRVARKQIARAVSELGGPDRARGVHEARKRMKRLRSLLRALRGVMGDSRAIEAARFRNIARCLSGPRDARVLADTAAGLAVHAGNRADAVKPVAEALDAVYRTLVAEGGEAGAIDAALDELDRAAAAVAVWPLDGVDRDRLLEGIVASYRGGRRAWSRMRRRAGGTIAAEDFHDWRKKVQAHWHHMRLLRRLWPDVMAGREAAAKRLSDLLGRDHDLAALSAALADGEVVREARRRRTVVRLIGARQHIARRECAIIARRLYAEKAPMFAKRLAAYWRAAELEVNGG